MRIDRRAFLRDCLVRVAGFLVAGASAGSRAADVASAGPGRPDALRAAMKQELGDVAPLPSTAIELDLPRIAEDGGVVPVTVESRIPGTDRVLLFVERNPVPLAAVFDFAAGTDPFVSLRIRVAESCEVLAVARSGGRYHVTRRAVRVVVGGCG